MKVHQKTIGNTDVWFTPKNIIDSLGEFDLDPCTSMDRPWDTAKNHFTIDRDGLSQEWYGRVWCNPPFNRNYRAKWMARMEQHGNGIMLIPAACETKAFKTHVLDSADGILMLNHRPHFFYSDGSKSKLNCGCTICLVAYGKYNLDMLLKSGLGTILTVVK